jgi:hypothetical protein
MPVVQSSQGLLITAGDRAQQGDVVAITGILPHHRSRPRTPMHTLSDRQAHPVPRYSNHHPERSGLTADQPAAVLSVLTGGKRVRDS